MATENKMETELCENCKKQVPAENYQMHFVHCKRNIQLCPLCGEAVSRKEEKEHFEEYHTKIDCVQCGQKTTRIEERNHLANECGKRPILCQYCDISLPRERIAEHEEFCGSRTELCPKCIRYVLIKDLQKHAKSCDGGSSSVAALPCEFCGVPIAYGRLDTHQRQCLIERQSLQGHVPLLVEGDDGLLREIVAGKSTVASNQEVTGSGNRTFTRSVSHESAEAHVQQANLDDSIVALPCEICGELCPSDRLMDHQEECRQESENDLDQESLTSEMQEAYGSNFRFERMWRNHPTREIVLPHDFFGNLFQQSLFRELGRQNVAI